MLAKMIPSNKAKYDVAYIRQDFPCLSRTVHGKPLVYFDNAATAQRPQSVLDAMNHYYTQCNANVHRGVHTLSAEATDLFEAARRKLAKFINAPHEREVIFTRGTTEAINLVAQSWARSNLKVGDSILITHMEHHSNIVPWQLVCEQTGAKLKVAPIDQTGALIVDEFIAMLTPDVKLAAMVHVSNALGTVNPVAQLCQQAKQRGIVTLVDGSQAMPHIPVDVQSIGCDFYTVTGHKMYGPTGIGLLWGRAELLEAMPPWQGGGEMIKVVSFDGSTFNELPHKFEAGTPNIAGAIGLAAAADYLLSLDLDKIVIYEQQLLAYASKQLQKIEGLRLIGTAAQKVPVLSFTLEGAHPHDVGTIIDHEGVAIRTGHHCAMPLMKFFQVPATARASLALYNTEQEVDQLVAALQKARKMLL